MNNLLAIDTATDALSVALVEGEQRRALHRLLPRQHQQQLFPMLEELLEGRAPAALDLDAIVFGRGPGSFTGIRIAVSAAQGLGYSLGIPLIGQSSLETQARTLLRSESLTGSACILSTIDARIGQIYAQFFYSQQGFLEALTDAVLIAPDDLALPEKVPDGALWIAGNGFDDRSRLPAALATAAGVWPELRPEAVDMLEPAQACLVAGKTVDPADAVPDYVQKRIGWKTLKEQEIEKAARKQGAGA